jgi:pimeloyl-ACP methyl ester carboxylesterase
VRKSPHFCLVLIAFALVAACVPATASSNRNTRALALQDCQLSAPGMTFRYAAQCGTLTVFENRSARSGRQIDLRIAVLPATGNTVAPDPLFLLAGGPGQAATETFLPVLSAFDRINRKRDVVLVDQRGTGQSHPPPGAQSRVRCPQPQQDLAALPDAQLAVELKTCLSQLDADPRLYTTSIAMDDLDQVRSALGYDKINLYGASYGTRAALTYLRQHPKSVRTVILDGVMPQDWLLGPSAGRDAQRALDLIWDRCEAEPACRAAFPNIRTEFETLLVTLERQPVHVTVAHPVTGVPTEVALTRRQVASTVRLLSYSSESAALLPLLVHAAQSTGDYSRLAAQYLILNDAWRAAKSRDLDQRVSDGTYWSILCAEDAAFLTQETGSPQIRTYLDDVTADVRRVCATWPRGPVSADFRQPVTSETPVLLLSGEADPVTPPANGDQAARTLSNSLHLVAPGQGHTVISRGCIPKIAAAFVESGTVKGLESDCVKHIQPTPFFVSFAGPDS